MTIPANGMCLPNSFCSASGNSLRLRPQAERPAGPGQSRHPRPMQAGLQRLVGEGLDFPPAGVYGFAFTLPAAFTPNDQGQAQRPVPNLFPTTTSSSSPNWLSQFVNTAITPDSATGGDCYYPQLPGGTNCPVLP